MDNNYNKIFLKHGTISDFEEIDVHKGKGYKDFGQGFYLAVQTSQAEGMAKSQQERAWKREGILHKKFIYSFVYKEGVALRYKPKVFKAANIEWFDFIINNRDCATKAHNYPIVIGPTADDSTWDVIDAYFSEIYGQVGSFEAKSKAIKELETEKLGIQYYFSTNEAARAVLGKPGVYPNEKRVIK